MKKGKLGNRNTFNFDLSQYDFLKIFWETKILFPFNTIMPL